MNDTTATALDLFQQTGAYLRGHFRLTSGLHSPEYLQCALVLQHPSIAERLGRELAARIRTAIPGLEPTVVVSPALGGIIIGLTYFIVTGSIVVILLVVLARRIGRDE